MQALASMKSPKIHINRGHNNRLLLYSKFIFSLVQKLQSGVVITITGFYCTLIFFSLVQKLQSGVVIYFEKIGPDPPVLKGQNQDEDRYGKQR